MHVSHYHLRLPALALQKGLGPYCLPFAMPFRPFITLRPYKKVWKNFAPGFLSHWNTSEFLTNESKVVSITFLLVCFLSLKRALVKLGKCFQKCFSLQKLFSFSIKSNFRFSDMQILWRHQIPEHKTRNTFYWITVTREVNTVC